MTAVRNDIQTLRGIAVVMVVGYHLGVPGFANGFVGVDIFFVISGYLIMQVVDGSRSHGITGLLQFAESRGRRLYPALIVTILACVALGHLTQPPDEVRRLDKHAALATMFLSNVAFWREAGYFDAASHTKPLLHTWSLAVEGQYYLVFSAFMFVLGQRLRKGTLVCVLGLVAVASFALSLSWTSRSPSAAFYLLPARVWEFLCGALIAALQGKPRQVSAFGNAGGLLVAASLAVPLLVRFPAGEFPGYWAVLATIPAVLLVAGGGIQNRCELWQAGPGVFFGNISYSLYLWHWPAYVFARALGYVEAGLIVPMALFAASTLIGFLSYRYVETPFRRNRQLWTSRRFAVAAAGSLALSVPLLASGTGLLGAPADASQPDVKLVLDEVHNGNPRRAECFLGQEVKDPYRPLCRFGAPGIAPSFLLWGDSHADSLMTAVGEAGRSRGQSGVFAGFSGCPPLLEVRASERDPCTVFNARIYGDTIRNSGIESVIMVARWSNYLLGEVGTARPAPIISFGGAYASLPDAHQGFRASLLDTVCGLTASGKQVVLVAPVPEVGENVPGALAAPRLSWFQRVFAHDRDIRVSTEAYRRRNHDVIDAMREAQARCGARVLDPAAAMCAEGGWCRIEEKGRPLYRDGDHLSEFGAAQLLPVLSKAFDQ